MSLNEYTSAVCVNPNVIDIRSEVKCTRAMGPKVRRRGEGVTSGACSSPAVEVEDICYQQRTRSCGEGLSGGR